MVKKLQLLFLVTLFGTTLLFASETFLLKSKDGVWAGKNFENTTSVGYVVYSPSQTEKSSWDNGYRTIRWISKYNSLTFNQYSKDLPVSGINEEGLFVDTSPLMQTIYSYKSEFNNINEYEFVKYSLDNFSTVDEVVAFARKTNIAPLFDKVQYFVADKRGNAAIIEYLDGNTVVYVKETLPYSVLNSYSYEFCLENLNRSDKRRALESEDFITIVNKIYSNDTVEPSSDGVLSLLTHVSKEQTKWQIAYDLSENRVFFKTSESPAVKTIDLDKITGENQKFIEMTSVSVGDVSSKMKDMTTGENAELMNNIFEILPKMGFESEDIALMATSSEENVKKALESRSKRTATLKVIIHGLDNDRGKLNISLYNSESSFNKSIPFVEGFFEIKNTMVTAEFYNIIIDQQYAFTFFHDTNMNGKMDRHWTGLPKESWGSSRRGSSFEKSAFILKDRKQVEAIKNRGFFLW